MSAAEYEGFQITAKRIVDKTYCILIISFHEKRKTQVLLLTSVFKNGFHSVDS